MPSNKRKREAAENTVSTKKPKAKKRFSNRNKKTSRIIPSVNTYSALPADDEPSDSESVFDFNRKKHTDIVLDDEIASEHSGNESDDIVIVSDPEQEEGTKSQSNQVEQTSTNELAQNNDFIEFGFASSSEEEEEKEDGEFSDDGVISNDEAQVNALTPTSLYPWIKAHDHSKQKEIADWLTMEIKDFVSYISPSKEEIMARNSVVKTLKQQIKVCWPDAEAHVFGSFATDLYLPGSDIDMVVVSKNGDCENRHKLYQLSSFLRSKKLAKDIEVIAGAKVPIIKFVDPKTNIHLDISFERTNGLDAARRIRKWLETTAGLRELVLVVKQFLRSRKLNNVHVGGLGGYATIILCYHFIKMHPRVSTENMTASENLGTLLIEFFELYGRNFSFDNLVIAFDGKTDSPKYLKKYKYPSLIASRNPFALVVQDPDDPGNNITRSSYNLRDIKKSFGGAFQLLVDRCYYLHSASYKKRIGQSILGDIIKYKGKERDFKDERDLVVNHALVKHGNNDDEVIEVTDKEDEEVEIIDDQQPVLPTHKYYSDATVESDQEDSTFSSALPPKPAKAKVNVGKYLSLDETSSSDDETNNEKKPNSLPRKPQDKEKVREYWLQKGSGL
ncbi:Poly(A) polymerase [Yamadazyma tenuis]|uniref:polynucleotide adenylyltransferase n=1 Tax=Candida tenuis (strain ATCC 10573 / BCRC 21748 / CBS 615 / JCM 9827 / NBRC 10315 / NRRL Y-1498 / VKM Y-70) TaxID=590646 RepID=G3B839_CANTC|nr:uncharacterized protein CANTEDRAFT_126141 [Yamadazyma tenuis ATCC 10573]EGV62342.1 hypothetical protein CANTEDRAFT_126141 [Yamadazyma tenuis ATCC 10573]WEJ93607.1 Poly(A) polymerase [Yamadazyma tenuis]